MRGPITTESVSVLLIRILLSVKYQYKDLIEKNKSKNGSKSTD